MNGAVNRDYDDILRRALHAAAESIEPSADGLERIRERLGRPPLLSFSSAAGWYSVAAVRFTGWAVPALGTACEIFWALVDRFKPADYPPGHAKPGLRWLRPVTATALAIFVVAGGAFAAMAIPRAINASTEGNASGQGNGGGGGAGVSGAVDGHGSQRINSASGSPAGTGTASSSPTAATKCHSLSSAPATSFTPIPRTSDSTVPTTGSTSPGPTSSSPGPTSTSPSPTTSDTSPTQPSSGTTGTPGTAAASNEPSAPTPSGSSSSSSDSGSATGSDSPSAPAVGGSQSAAGRNQTAAPVGSSSSGSPCQSSSPSTKATHKLSHTVGLGQPDLVISSSGRAGWYVLPSGRDGVSF